jgi:uncharacterized beta-barrel protein YwiB (DUF1934 family)
MKKCRIQISTITDGNRQEIVREGEFLLLPRSAVLCYNEDSTQVNIRIDSEKALVERNGDYYLSLRLEKGKTTEGILGIGGNEGKILSQTHELEYRISESMLVLSLVYDLIFGDERQKMHLRLLAMEM